MPLSDHDSTEDPCSGSVAAVYEDMDHVQDHIETFLQENLAICVRHLPGFGSRAIRTVGESSLCESLCIRINSYAIGKALFRFYPEMADSGNRSRAPDFTAVPELRPTELLRVGSQNYDCEVKLYVIEAKRLPAPPGTRGGDRSREYVVSDWDQRNASNKPLTGGIERFKESAHGSRFTRAGMIGFLQTETPDHWLAEINSWIRALIDQAIPRHEASWATSDFLHHFANPPASPRLSQYRSRHGRIEGLPPILLCHFWLALT